MSVQGFATVSGVEYYDYSGLQGAPTQSDYNDIIDEYFRSHSKNPVTDEEKERWNNAPVMTEYKLSIPQPKNDTEIKNGQYYKKNASGNYVPVSTYEGAIDYYNKTISLQQSPNDLINIIEYTPTSSSDKPPLDLAYGQQKNTLYINKSNNKIYKYVESSADYVQITRPYSFGYNNDQIYDGGNGYLDRVHSLSKAGEDIEDPKSTPSAPIYNHYSDNYNPHGIKPCGIGSQGLHIRGKDISNNDVTPIAFDDDTGRVTLSGNNIGDVVMGIIDAQPDYNTEQQPINGGRVRPESARSYYMPLSAKNIFGSVLTINGIGVSQTQTIPSGTQTVPYETPEEFAAYHNIVLNVENIPGALNGIIVAGSTVQPSAGEHIITLPLITESEIKSLFATN